MRSKPPFGRRRDPSPDQGRSFFVKDSNSSYASSSVDVLYLKAVAAVGLLALGSGVALLGFQQSVARACVDDRGLVVSDSNCSAQPTPSPSSSSSRGYYGSIFPYRWHYGASSYEFGRVPVGGSYDMPSSPTYTHSSSLSGSGGTSRGFFGSWGHRYGGGWS